MSDAPTVVIVDDHQLFRAGVRAELDGLVEVLGDAANVEDAVRCIVELAPDVVLLDVQMPGGGGVQVIRDVAKARPAQRFLALSVSDAAEVGEERAEVFVRDRGPGFDVSAVPLDRRGVRESIVGRMDRHGGRAVVHSSPGAGTEVELVMER